MKQLAVQISGMFIVFALILFASAGTVRWLAGWCFLILFFGFVIALSSWLLRHNPELLTERMTGIGNAGQQRWDKVFFVLANVFFLGWLILMPMDAVRFHWSHLSLLVQAAGAEGEIPLDPVSLVMTNRVAGSRRSAHSTAD